MRKFSQEMTIGDVPNKDAAVGRSGSEKAAVRGKRDAEYSRFVAWK